MTSLNFQRPVLVVPIHLDALVLAEDQMVVASMTDFTRLPWSTTTQDHNPGTANLSEQVLSRPFGNQNLPLRKGVHLHWALPDALAQTKDTSKLGKAVAGNGCLKAPNRWLVIKYTGSNTIVSKTLIESDLLHPLTDDPNQNFTHIPTMVTQGVQNPGVPPFQYLGKSYPFDNWEENSKNTYWEDLSALGYGEPAFAAFYPNCHSVFGHYDDTQELKGVTYDVIGWYSDLKNDPLKNLILSSTKKLTGASLVQAIKKEFNWAIEAGKIEPEQILCYGRVTPDYTGPASSSTAANVAVGTNAASGAIDLMANNLGIDSTQKATFTEQLEAILLDDHVEDTSPDYVASLDRAKHRKGFQAYHGGTCWSIKPLPGKNANQEETPAMSALPEHLVQLLDTLNVTQKAHDQQVQSLKSKRHQLFSDWYRYMIARYPEPGLENAYPDADEMRYFITNEIAQQINPQETAIGTYTLEKGAHSFVTGATATIEGYYTTQLVNALTALCTALTDNNQNEGSVALGLTEVPADHFFHPVDPVLMLEGASLSANARNGMDENLACAIVQLPTKGLTQQWVQIQDSVKDVGNGILDQPTKFNPIFIEWEAFFNEVNKGGSDYSSDYINSHFQVPIQAVDFEALTPPSKASNELYQGRSYINAKSGIYALKAHLAKYLIKWVVPPYIQSLATKTPPEANETYLNENLTAIVNWIKSQYKDYSQMPYSATLAYANLESITPLAQVLNGFHDALLMQKLTLQMGVDDPLAFDNDGSKTTFAQQVAKAVDGHIRSAPLAEGGFNPIRAGILQMNKLQIVDSFGLTQVVDPTWIGEDTSLESGSYPLPPRLSQPALLSCEWLSASDGAMEMNHHPASSPICGWLLPNNLENSLAVYDSEGVALGAITQNAAQPWQPAPGLPTTTPVTDIQNAYLQQLVQFVIEQGSAYLPDFVTALDSAQQNIHPDNSLQNIELSLLMGRPVAVTRVAVGLTVRGDLATDQGWNAFRSTLQQGGRNTQAFEEVLFPLRIGEFEQFNDGVLGYFQEPYAEQNGTYYAIQSTEGNETTSGTGSIVTHTSDPANLQITVNGDIQYLTVLFDPRGTLHATSGILPVKRLVIPPSHYVPALQKIQVTFLTAPILSGTDLALPLTSEPGYNWSFVEQISPGTWHEINRQGVVNFEQVAAKFKNASALWGQMLENNWLQATGNTSHITARIVPKDQRSMDKPGVLQSVQQQMERFLDGLYISTTDTRARFKPNLQLREGWLKLTPNIPLEPAAQSSTTNSATPTTKKN